MTPHRRFRPCFLAAALAAAFLLSASSAKAQAPPDAYSAELAQVAKEAQQAYEAKNWEEAADLFLRGAELAPVEIAAPYLYNCACSLSLAGDVEEALVVLERAIEAGFVDAPLIATDSDLDNLRAAKGDLFPGLVAKAASLRRELDEKDPDGFIFLPANFDPKKPCGAIVALHPYGGNPAYMVNMWKPIADERGMVLVVVRAALPMGGGRYEWDMPRIGMEASKIVRWLSKALDEHPNIDQRRLILTGYSQGGAVACWMGLSAPGIWAGIIPVAAPNPIREQLKARALPGRPILVYSIIGDRDKEAFLEFNRYLKRVADDKALKVELRILPAVGHSMPKWIGSELHKALDWVEAENAKLAQPEL